MWFYDILVKAYKVWKNKFQCRWPIWYMMYMMYVFEPPITRKFCGKLSNLWKTTFLAHCNRINYNKPMMLMVKQNPNAEGPWQEVWEYPDKYHALKHYLLLVWQNRPCLLQPKQPFSINKKCYGRLCQAPLARLFEFIFKVYSRSLFLRNGR